MTLAALDQLDQGISVFDQQLRLVGWNKHYVELLAFPPDFAWLGRPFADFIRYNAERGEYGPGDPEEQTRARVELAKRFEPHCFERTRPDGTILEIRGKRLVGGGFVTVYTDITERKRIENTLKENRDLLEARVAERTAELQALNQQLVEEIAERKRVATALWESESWMRLIMDAIPARIAYVGANQRYDFANKKHEELYGIPADQFIGRHIGAVVDSTPRDRRQEHIDAALSGQATSFESEFTNPNNRTFYLRTTYLPHLSTDGKVLGFFILGEDLTEYKQTQLALSQAQKMDAVGQLTGGLAHDFNNLLTIMTGNLAYLEDDPVLSQDAREAVQTTINAVKRGAELTRRLLAFSRRQTLQPRVIDLPRLLADVRQFLQRTLGSGIDVEVDIAAGIWHVLADPNELSNALLNLGINARDAITEGGKILIGASNSTVNADTPLSQAGLRPGDYARLSVIDNGSGMPPEVVEHAFEPFFSTKEAGAGTGLGLSMVYGFSKQSGGHARIISQPDEGTTVELYLPRARPSTAARTAAARQAGATQPSPGGNEPALDGASVLVVEDEPEVRKFIVRSLTEAGCAVQEAPDAPSALAVLQHEPSVDLLLSDIVMPGGYGGWELIGTVQRQYPTVRCLAMSGYAERAKKMSPHRVRGATLLHKPFDKTTLIRAVQAALRPLPDS